MIDRIQARAKAFSLTMAAVAILAVVPFLLGWAVGVLLRALFFALAAFIEGYKVGRG